MNFFIQQALFLWVESSERIKQFEVWQNCASEVLATPAQAESEMRFNPISTECFKRKTSSMPQNSKMAKAIALKLGDFSQISISSILNVIN